MDNDNLQQQLLKLDKIKQRQGGDGIRLPFVERTDHTMIYLYTALNKKIGKLTIPNAEWTIKHYAKKDIDLYLEPRTPEQIEEYKKTPKYKRLHAAWKKQREDRHRSSQKQDFAAVIAKETGKAVADALADHGKK